MNPEAKARETIDRLLTQAGWYICDYSSPNISAGLGVAIREFQLGKDAVDNLLYVDGKAAGVIEAKKEGSTLTGAAIQSAKYDEAGFQGERQDGGKRSTTKKFQQLLSHRAHIRSSKCWT